MDLLAELQRTLDNKDARIAELEAENARLTAHVNSFKWPVFILMAKYTFTRGEAVFIYTLFEAKGELVTFEQMDAAMPAMAGERNIKNVLNVRARAVRKKLGQDAVKNHFGKGYSITEVGVAQVREVLGRDVPNSTLRVITA